MKNAQNLNSNVAVFKYHLRGVDIACLDTTKQWQFTPANFREGQIISGGDIFGTVSNFSTSFMSLSKSYEILRLGF